MKILRSPVRIYFEKNINGGVRRFCNTESRDDDEFLFPVQILQKDEIHFRWSGAEVSNSIDLAAASFVGEKKIIFSTENLKVG